MSLRSFPAAGILAGLVLAGCQSEGPRGRFGSTGGAPMTASGQLAMTDPQPMDAQGSFFGGKIGVEAMLAKSDAPWKNAASGESGERGGPGGGRSGFSGGFGGGFGGGRRGDSGDASAGDPAGRTATMRASNEPPAQLRLRLTNHGENTTDIEVLDFNSDLGNFVVQPEKITLLPHDSAEADPMTSRLGVPAFEAIPLTVRIRIDGPTGKSETQVLKLQPRTGAASPATS